MVYTQMVEPMVVAEPKISAEAEESLGEAEPVHMAHLADFAAVAEAVEHRSTVAVGTGDPGVERSLAVVPSCGWVRMAIAIVVRIGCKWTEGGHKGHCSHCRSSLLRRSHLGRQMRCWGRDWKPDVACLAGSRS